MVINKKYILDDIAIASMRSLIYQVYIGLRAPVTTPSAATDIIATQPPGLWGQIGPMHRVYTSTKPLDSKHRSASTLVEQKSNKTSGAQEARSQ